MREGWTYKKLGEVAEIKSGYTPSFTDLLDDGYLPYFKVGDMNLEGNEKYLYYTSSYLDTTFKSYPKYSIVFPKNGAAIATNKKRILSRPSVVDLNTAVLIANNSVNYEYLYYWICKIDFKTITRRGAVPTLDIKTLIQFPIPVPPLSEQERIVSELDLLSGIIEKKKTQLKEYDQLAQSIFYDMFGDPVTNEKGWEVKKLGEGLSYIKNGANIKQTKGASGIPITRIESLSNGVFNRDRLGYADIYSTENYSQYVLDDKDILMSHINSKAYIGRSVVYHKVGEETILHGMNLLRLKVIPSLYLSVYLDFLFKSDYFKERVARIRKDAVNQSSMAISDLVKIPIPLPPLSLQQSITEVETLFNSRMDYYFN